MALALVAGGFKDMPDLGEREVAFAPQIAISGADSRKPLQSSS
jgi:hypothetical protein